MNRNRIISILTLVLIVLTVGCTFDRSYMIAAMKSMEDARNSIKKEFTSHFPENLDFKYGYRERRTIVSEYNEGLELSVRNNLDKKDLIVIEDSLKKISLKIIKLDDPCIFNIDRPYHKEPFTLTGCKDFIPLPNYPRWQSMFGGLNGKIPKDLTFYVLDASPGHFLPDSLLTNGGGLPEKWKNGFVKGISTTETEEKIIYWVTVW